MSYRMSIDLTDLKRFSADLRRAPDLMQKELTAGIARSANAVQTQAKGYAPHKTGTLQSSIHTEGPTLTARNITATVGTDLEYAKYQETGVGELATPPRRRFRGKIPGVGWRWIKGFRGRFYMKKARIGAMPLFQNYMKQATQNIIKGLTGR